MASIYHISYIMFAFAMEQGAIKRSHATQSSEDSDPNPKKFNLQKTVRAYCLLERNSCWNKRQSSWPMLIFNAGSWCNYCHECHVCHVSLLVIKCALGEKSLRDETQVAVLDNTVERTFVMIRLTFDLVFVIKSKAHSEMSLWFLVSRSYPGMAYCKLPSLHGVHHYYHLPVVARSAK